MPRRGRLDAPGAIHHVFARGVARGRIFSDDKDRSMFIGHFSKLIVDSKAACFAWSLLNNHFHILIRTGEMPLSKIMQKLLTWYSVNYNRRHHRVGHLFQNRYGAILCEEEAYLVELVRYIHLNPLGVGDVEDLKALGSYRWCGHGAIVGKTRAEWQETKEILARFGRNKSKARASFYSFMNAGLKMSDRDLLRGGGLIRSAGGIYSLIDMARNGERVRGDDRILGSGEFVATALKNIEKRDRRREWVGKRYSPKDVLERAAKEMKISVDELVRHGKRPAVVKARSLACKWLVEDLGLSGVKAGLMLGIASSTVSKHVLKGKEIEAKLGIKLDTK